MRQHLLLRCLTAFLILSVVMTSSACLMTQISTAQTTPTASAAVKTDSVKTEKKGPLIAVDAGHQKSEDGRMEKADPDKNGRKIRNTSGCSGASTGMPEYNYTLKIAKKLKKELEKRGYRVYMTRTKNAVKFSNRERALKINKKKAAACIRLHCDSFGSSASGASIQYRSKTNSYISKKVAKKNTRLSRCILKKYCKATKMKNRGLVSRNDLTGCNWAKVPTTLIEMGFFSNPREERKMLKASFQKKMVKGIADGFDAYFKR